MGITQKVGGTEQIANLIGPKEIWVFNGVSFETNEDGAIVIPIPYKCRVLSLESIVTTALAATDSGTITPASSTGNITGGVLTHAASAAQGDVQTAATLTANDVVGKDTDFTLTPAKTTAGGRVAVAVTVQRIL